MPRIFSPVDINTLDKDLQKDYFDRHSPRIICENESKYGEKFKVKVIVGEQYLHPNDPDHFIGYVQLWNRETMLAEVRFTSAALGNNPNQAEVDFYILPPQVSMNLTAMSYCSKHGLWQSEPKAVKVIDK